jgi:glycosyltransferase involved in cell wall biosynthesis
LRDASKVIAEGQEEAEQYKAMGVREEKIVVISNGIDLSEFSDLPPKGCFKKKFNIPEDKKIILYLGRIHKIKGIDFLVKAYAHLTKSMNFNDAILVIAGPDDGYLRETQALINSLKIDDIVLLTGPLYGRDKLEAYIDADVYVLPSRYENWGLTALEAVACGTPVILTENCGAAKYFKDKVGLVVKPDSSHLAEALLEMFLSQDKRELFRENGRTLIEKFSISEVVSELEKVYEEVRSSGRT